MIILTDLILTAGLLNVTVTIFPDKSIVLTSGKELKRTFTSISEAYDFLTIYYKG